MEERKEKVEYEVKIEIGRKDEKGDYGAALFSRLLSVPGNISIDSLFRRVHQHAAEICQSRGEEFVEFMIRGIKKMSEGDGSVIA